MKFVSIFMTLFLFASCDSTRQTQYKSPSATFDTVLESDYGGNDEKKYKIIRSKSDLNKEIAALTLDEATINRLNAVDFRNQIVLSLHMGTRNTGGYGIKVSNVEINGNTTFVEIQETSPEAGQMVTMALTQPFCLVVMDTNENIIFK